MNLIAQGAPFVERPREATFFGAPDSAIDGNPCHHLRVREVLAGSPHLPDTRIGLAPDFGDVLDERALKGPCIVTSREPRTARLIKGIEHFAVDVELHLGMRRIADANGG